MFAAFGALATLTAARAAAARFTVGGGAFFFGHIGTALRVLRLGGAAFVAALGAFAALAWDRFFVLFHELSFGNDLWLFDPAVDPVINVLPDQFFFHEAMAIFGLVILGGIVCAVLHRRLSR